MFVSTGATSRRDFASIGANRAGSHPLPFVSIGTNSTPRTKTGLSPSLHPILMPEADVDALAREIFDWYVEHEPVFATHMGLHQSDGLMPDGRRQAKLAEIKAGREFKERADAIAVKGLSTSKKIDLLALRNAINLGLFEDTELAFWESFPSAGQAVGSALFTLFMRDFAPLRDRLVSITSRLEKSVQYIDQTKGRLTRPVKLWTEIGIESNQRLPMFLEVIERAAKDALPPADASRLAEASARTRQAIGAHARWLKEDVLPKGKGVTGIGAAKFRKLVRLRELGLTVEQIYAIGKKILRDSKRQLKALAGEIKPGASVDEAGEIVKNDHPAAFPEALAYTERAMREARAFIAAKDLATLPPQEELRVIETPSYIRHVIPFAAYSSPGKFEKNQLGLYMVTPVEDKPEMMREHNYAGTRNTAVHEGYPGHHLQLVCANANPSLARALVSATESIEGWAHYCEDMMKAAGFSADPRTKFVQVRDQIWRACRILIDVDLHSGRMTFDDAVDLLVREAGMERPGALAEVKRYTYTPAYQLSYLIGKHLIQRLRADVERSMGDAYTDKFFHDTFLYAGSLPAKHMRLLFEDKMRGLGRLRRKGL
ncbi:MAG: DUF885 domain-containing protein [Methanobacteriota archaeon]|nr:MAG: DUF885 domain-containing protein [Euryarchaeota archaeon]